MFKFTGQADVADMILRGRPRKVLVVLFVPFENGFPKFRGPFLVNGGHASLLDFGRFSGQRIGPRYGPGSSAVKRKQAPEKILTPRTKLKWALYWAGRGIPVIPLVADSKRPLVQSGKGHGNASLDQDTIRKWWGEWPNADMGGIPALADPPLFVVDEDPKNGGDSSMLDLEMEHGSLPRTLTSKTPSGGYHRWFRGTGKTSTSKIAPGIDIRGAGGLAVLPGSGTKDHGYVLVDPTDPVDAPDWLARLVAPEDGEGRKNAISDELDLPVNLKRTEEFLQGARPSVEGHGGNATAYETACWVRDLGVSEDTCLASMLEHWNDRCVPP